jgi:histidyl-tRNA synthetase
MSYGLKIDIDEKRSVTGFPSDDGDYILWLFEKNGKETEIILSIEAVACMVSVIEKLFLNGCAEKIKQMDILQDELQYAKDTKDLYAYIDIKDKLDRLERRLEDE